MPFDIKKNPRHIAILATGQGWDLAPKLSEKTIYALNDYVSIEKYRVKPDVLFMMDILDEKPQVVSNQQDLGETIKRINGMKIPFIGPYKYEEIPLSEAFPIEECVKQFGLPFFTNTICFMIAYALMQGAKEIELFGVNQAGSHEYMEEKGGVEYWLGMATGMGVKVTIHGHNSQLLRYKGRTGRDILYGYLQTFPEIVENKKRFGEFTIKQLLKPSPPFSRQVRRIK